MMDKQAREARKMAKELPFWKKVGHIWSYYKLWFIGGGLFLLLVGSMAWDLTHQPSYDMEVAFYSDLYFVDDKITALEEYLTNYVEDRDGDGEKTVKVHSISIAMMGENSEGEMAVRNKFVTDIIAGNYPIFFFDEYFYQVMQEEAYANVMECYHTMTDVPEIAEILKVPDGASVYWGTRTIYQGEDVEEATPGHDLALQMERSIFGARENM